MAIGDVFTITGRESGKVQLFKAVANACGKSPTCAKIWETIEKSKITVDFVVFTGGGNAEALVDEEQSGVGAFGFNPREKYLDLKRGSGAVLASMPNPVVYWCPDCRYTVYAHIAPAGALLWNAGGYTINAFPTHVMQKATMFGATRNLITRPLVWATKLLLSPEVVLFHELGHIRQYLTAKAKYVGWLGSNNIAALEADNLEKHEWPICQDYHYGRRANYHEDETFLSNLKDFAFFRCADPHDRADLDQKVSARSSQITFRQRQVTKVDYFPEYRASIGAL